MATDRRQGTPPTPTRRKTLKNKPFWASAPHPNGRVIVCVLSRFSVALNERLIEFRHPPGILP